MNLPAQARDTPAVKRIRALLIRKQLGTRRSNLSTRPPALLLRELHSLSVDVYLHMSLILWLNTPYTCARARDAALRMLHSPEERFPRGSTCHLDDAYHLPVLRTELVGLVDYILFAVCVNELVFPFLAARSLR